MQFDETQEQLAQRLSYQQQQNLTPTRNSIGSPEVRLPSVEVTCLSLPFICLAVGKRVNISVYVQLAQQTEKQVFDPCVLVVSS